MDKIEEAFEKLKEEGKTSLDDVINWIKETKVIEDTKEAEEEARKLFADVNDVQDIEMERFKEGIEKMAAKQNELFKYADFGVELVAATFKYAGRFQWNEARPTKHICHENY